MLRSNLEKMRDHLMSVNPEHFSMGSYLTDVAGHCVTLDPGADNFYDADGEFMWDEWTEHFTGLKFASPEWTQVFSYKWHTIDDTLQGAIERINTLLRSTL